MIVYNVTTKIERDIAPDWGAWMKGTHIPAIMGTGLFSGYRLMRILEEREDGDDGLTYAVQYLCPSAQQFDEYLKTHASAIQQAARDKFYNKTVTIRTLMQVIEEEAVFSQS